MYGQLAVEIPSIDQGPVALPHDLPAWIQGIREMIKKDGRIYLHACSTDWPGVFAIGFTSEPDSSDNIQTQMQTGRAFGFYVDDELAKQLAALFGLIAASK